MAFNPFESFRKNSKAMLAVLTIFIMFVFILSSGVGGGDFFDWVARQLGGRDTRGSVMGEIDGKEYHARDLEEVRKNRQAANLFMVVATQNADMVMLAQIEQDLKNNLVRNPEFAKELQDGVTAARTAIETQHPQAIIGLSGSFRFLNSLARSFTDKDNAAELRNLRRMERISTHCISRLSRDNMFFREIPNKDNSDALDFLMLLKEAERLEVTFTDEDIEKLIGDETDGVLNDEKVKSAVWGAIRKNYKLSDDMVRTAIGDEYRVQMAIGIIRGRSTRPAAQTPFDMFEYYKNHCTTLKFEVIDLPVEMYLPLVKVEPTNAELAAMYDNYARQEFDPSRRDPGFKEPRKLKIEYIGLDDSLPLYRTARAPMKAASIIAAPFQIAGGSDPFGGAFAATSPLFAEYLMALDAMRKDRDVTERRLKRPFNPVGPRQPRLTGLFFIQDMLESRLWRDYLGAAFEFDGELFRSRPPMFRLNLVEMANELQRLNVFVDRRRVDPFTIPSEPLIYHPLPVASLTAQLAIATNPVAAASGAVAGLRNTAQLLDTRARVAAGMQIAMAPLSFNPAFGFTSTTAALANLPVLPDGYWVAVFLDSKTDRKQIEKQLALRDYNRLREKLNDIRKKLAPPEEKKDDLAALAPPKKKDTFKLKPEDVKKANDEARALIDQFIKDRTFKGEPSIHTGKSQMMRDSYDAAEDPGVKELKDAAMLAASRRKPIPDAKDIYTAFQTSFYTPALDAKDNLEAKYFTPVVFPQGFPFEELFSDPVYLAWRIEDVPAKQVPYDKITPEMKAKVVTAWKIRKARELAAEDAQKVSEAVRALGQKYLVDADNLPAFKTGLTELTAKSDKAVFLHGYRGTLQDPTVAAIENLAFFTEHPPLQANTRPTFMLPNIRHRDIVYPLSIPEQRTRFDQTPDPWNGREMASMLLDVRSKPLGETVVVKDTPEMHFYVCAMTEKTPPTLRKFYDVYRLMLAPESTNRMGQGSNDEFYRRFIETGRTNQDRDMLQRIRADLKFKETDELKKSLEKRDGSSE